VGAFASLYDIDLKEYEHPVLVLKTEEPGSKQLIAAQYDRIESVCYDMINHLVNDCIVMGAKPLTVQDAVICGKLEKDIVLRIVRAISSACREQECTLTGGETSEQPGVIAVPPHVSDGSVVDRAPRVHGPAGAPAQTPGFRRPAFARGTR
jgi:phosphoribosylformylglycinamidine cyclo-ligase